MYKERINALIAAINNEADEADRELDLETVINSVNSFPLYFNAVVNMELKMQIARFRYEGDAYRDFVQNLDHTRRLRHETLTANVNLMNRLSTILLGEKMFDSDRDYDMKVDADRQEAAQFAYDLYREILEGGSTLKSNVDDAIMDNINNGKSFQEKVM